MKLEVDPIKHKEIKKEEFVRPSSPEFQEE